jgi:predicted PurR-regulated permease PerM
MDTVTQKRSMEGRTRSFFGSSSVLFIIVALFAFLYLFFKVFVLAFSAVLVAVLLTLLARPFKKRLNLRHWAALTLAGLLLVCVIGAVGYLFGSRLAFDIQDVFARMESAQQEIRAELGSSPIGSLVLSHMGSDGIPVTQIVSSLFSFSTNVIAGVVVSVIAGIYFAAHPSIYLNGFLMLFPPDRRPEAEETTKDIGNALCLWLEGQFLSMMLVGLLSAAATWAIGLPSPLALGLIAGITEFIPYVGPIIAAIPALLVAATQRTDSIIWTLAAYLAIHTVEGNFIAPLIQRQMVYIPPAVMILGIAAIGFIFGPVAVIFAAPMTVVLFVLIKKLYVRDFLKEPTKIPGEQPVN